MQPLLGWLWKLRSSCHRQRHGEVSKWLNPFWERCLDIAPWMKISRESRGWMFVVGWLGNKNIKYIRCLGFNDRYKWSEINLINQRVCLLLFHCFTPLLGSFTPFTPVFLGPTCINCWGSIFYEIFWDKAGAVKDSSPNWAFSTKGFAPIRRVNWLHLASTSCIYTCRYIGM